MVQAIKPVPGSSPSLLPALSRIIDMAKLGADWDGEGADPTTAQAVASACFLIEAAAERREHAGLAGVPPATSSPIADGGLQVEWRGPRARIDIQVNPDGSYGYVVKWSAGPRVTYEEADLVSLETVLGLLDRVLAS